jgi:hypothetical protein
VRTDGQDLRRRAQAVNRTEIQQEGMTEIVSRFTMEAESDENDTVETGYRVAFGWT